MSELPRGPVSARDFAVQAHGNQSYGNHPYVHHLSAVVSVLEDFNLSADHVAAGWLHDVVEDTPVPLERIATTFGDKVAALVWAVTGEGHGDREAHSSSIYRKIAKYPEAAAVKLADRIANIEACARGDRHAVRYAREHPKFAEAVQQHVGGIMWQRYLDALESRS